MLGLLGTIWGMSKSFASLSAQMNQANDFENLIRYLSEAMYATAFGIVIASLSLIALFIFRFLFEQYFQNLEDSLNTFIELVAKTKLHSVVINLPPPKSDVQKDIC